LEIFRKIVRNVSEWFGMFRKMVRNVPDLFEMLGKSKGMMGEWLGMTEMGSG